MEPQASRKLRSVNINPLPKICSISSYRSVAETHQGGLAIIYLEMRE